MIDIERQAEIMLAETRVLQLAASANEEGRIFALVVRKATVAMKRLADALAMIEDEILAELEESLGATFDDE